MRAYLAILPMLALVGCNPSAVERGTDTGPKLSSKADLMDFADHPEKWKGKTITAKMIVYTYGAFKNNMGRTVEAGVYDSGLDYKVFLDVPQNASVPEHDGSFIVTFACENGSLKNGNKVMTAIRD